LCDILPARPTSTASYPVSVRRVATLLHASFRRSLAVPPLRFASASPPSGCTADFHPQTVGHVRHTGRFAPAAPVPLHSRAASLTPLRAALCRKTGRDEGMVLPIEIKDVVIDLSKPVPRLHNQFAELDARNCHFSNA